MFLLKGILCLILIWFVINLIVMVVMYAPWLYERRCRPEMAHLPGGSEHLRASRVCFGIVQEALAFMVLEATYPFGFWYDRHLPKLAPGKDTPVLLVHGYGCNSACMLWLARQLRKAGYRARAASYFPPTDNVHKLVPQIKQHIRRLQADAGVQKIHYIGHSMGGLLVRDVLADPEFADSIETVVCLGSPHHGSHAASIITPPVMGAASQMTYQSDYVKGLSLTPGNARYYGICSQMDNLVLPVSSAILPGADSRVVDYLGHCTLLYSPRVAALVLRCLALSE
jgi:pimeloyl-ACP methyl ester carboxylesterase